MVQSSKATRLIMRIQARPGSPVEARYYRYPEGRWAQLDPDAIAPGIPPDAVNFPRRNRIISGLSAATVIVEAGERSGAELMAAGMALDLGRNETMTRGDFWARLFVLDAR